MISSSRVWLVAFNIANGKNFYISRKWKSVFSLSERDHTGPICMVADFAFSALNSHMYSYRFYI